MNRVLIPAVMFATPALADPVGYGHMMDGGYGVGMIFGPVLWLVVLGLLVAGIIWLVRRLDNGAPQAGTSNAMAALDMRLAKGEIDVEEYSARKKLLGS